MSLLEITWGFIPFMAIFNWTDRKIYCHRRDPPPGYSVFPVACRNLFQKFSAKHKKIYKTSELIIYNRCVVQSFQVSELPRWKVYILFLIMSQLNLSAVSTSNAFIAYYKHILFIFHETFIFKIWTGPVWWLSGKKHLFHSHGNPNLKSHAGELKLPYDLMHAVCSTHTHTNSNNNDNKFKS